MYITLVIYLLSWLWLNLIFTVVNGMGEVKVVNYDPLSTVLLPCSTPNDVIWFNDGRPIVAFKKGDDKRSYDRYKVIHEYGDDRNLQFKMVKKSDEGNYRCFANGKTVIEYNLIVNYEAIIMKRSNATNEVKELSTIGLWCNATGMPAPKTAWYVVDDSGKEQPLGFTGNYLEVRNVTRRCSGTYRCKATNRLNGNSPAVADMRVNTVYSPEVDISLDEPEANVDNFTFDAANIEYTVYFRVPKIKRSTVVLTCHVKANPTANISWIVGKQVIGNYVSGQVNFLSGLNDYSYELTPVNGGLKLSFIVVGNHNTLFKGPYKCESTNKFGADQCSVKFKQADGNGIL